MSKEILLEIGTEEIPAAFIPKARVDMERIIAEDFADNRIRHGDITTMGTPRRLFLSVADVAERQDDQISEKLGPAYSVAFDDAGTPTKAALGFCRGQGIDIADVTIIDTEKGRYIASRRHVPGAPTADFLRDYLPRFIASIPFKKSMRWRDFSFRFARPIHWICALFGGEVIPLTIENIESGSVSYGHRFVDPASFEITSCADYREKTAAHCVIADPDERIAMIREQIRTTAEEVGGTVLENSDLLEEVGYLVEYPTAVRGSFDRVFLELPKDVLITTMIHHQKYFPILDADGNLMPSFITITNTPVRDTAVVSRGNEKVIRARLADARFFFEEDKEIPLENHVESLKNVTFHSLLGTSYEKVMRFRELALFLASIINPDITDGVDRAAILSKADLETQMVYEFTELQGVIGREYALIQGEDPTVAQAIYEHYLPTTAGGELPATDVGAVVGMADKMDTICGCFAVGLIPTGTADPYALRRQALGIINIILDKAYTVDIDTVIDKSLSILSPKMKRTAEETKHDVIDFFAGRYRNHLIAQGFAYDVVDAVFARGMTDILRVMRKVTAMDEFKHHPDYEPLAVAFKRVVNILKGFSGGTVDENLFEEQEERDLFHAYCGIEKSVETFIVDDRYEEALSTIATLRPTVDAFFDTVLVMADDERLRFNRLSLLEDISRLFFNVADFSRIATA